MMKRLFTFLFLSLGFTTLVMAENTDVSALDNTVYIEPVTATPGGTVTLSVKMKNTVEVEGLQFTLVLPTGVSVVTASETAASISTTRTGEGTFVLEQNILDDGSLIVMIASHDRTAFSGNDGEVATVDVKVDATTAFGTYPIYLRNIAIADNQEIPASYNTDEVETSITVERLKGDVNGDGVVGIGDIVTITNVMAGKETDAANIAAADVNGDIDVGIGDIVTITNIMAGK